jgi:hypothetical protein
LKISILNNTVLQLKRFLINKQGTVRKLALSGNFKIILRMDFLIIDFVGTAVGKTDGTLVGFLVGAFFGLMVGRREGTAVG